MNSWRFKCSCGRQIQQRCVEGVLLGGVVSGVDTVVVTYHCVCQEPVFEVVVQRFPANPSAVAHATCGDGAPWRNPELVRPVTSRHPDMLAWKQALERYGDDVDAFVERLSESVD